MTRFLSLYLPRLATDRIRRLQAAQRATPEPDTPGPAETAPLATVAKVKGAYRLAALDRQAARLGLKPGAPLADARAMVPTLIVHTADPAAERDTLLALVDWCRLFTPLAAPDGDDGAILDITGAAHLFGGEAELIKTITRRLTAQSFTARAAIAGSPGAAWALVRHGAPRDLIPDDIAERDHRRLFAAMPLAALRLDPRTVAQLGQAGLRRVGDLLVRPRAPIAARFGPNVFARLDDLFCRSRPISPRFPAPAFVAERRFVEGLVHRDSIAAVIAALATDLCGLLARHGEGARRLDLSLFRVDGVVKHVDVGTSRPLRDPGVMARLFHDKLETLDEEGLDTGYGFDTIRLAALAAERQDQHQPGWDENGAQDDLTDLVDRLGVRFGLDRVTRLALRDTHIPERAMTVVAAAMQPPASVRSQGGEGGLFPQVTSPWFVATPHDPPANLPMRPIRLLTRPEPITAIASVPDGPPLRFNWRRVTHHVAAIEGPERIAPEWWRSTAPPRDYFRAEDTDGQRFWLYREGLYHDAPEPRWFMHGLFA